MRQRQGCLVRGKRFAKQAKKREQVVDFFTQPR
jgi:hypothetical protein